MRAGIALLLLLCACTGARAENKEPFGAQFYVRSDAWASDLRIRFQSTDSIVISTIAEQVRQKPRQAWLTWVNQLVNLSVEVAGLSKKGICARKAVAKFEVLRQLGFPKEDLRLVFGTDSVGEHAVAAARSPEGWLVLDNGALIAGHKPLPDILVKGFDAKRSFN